MLMADPDLRDTPSRFLDLWEGVFRSAVNHAYALEGRAIR